MMNYRDCPHIREGETCSNCGYERAALPRWIKDAYYASDEVVFGFGGATYRVVSIGSTNDICSGYHWRDYVSVALIGADKPALPDAPVTSAEVGRTLASIFEGKRIFASELAKAPPLRSVS